MHQVLVTGANGHLGYNLVLELVRRGYQVRASVRDLKDKKKTNHLKKLDVELVEADLTNPISLENAIRGVKGIFHTAAPNLPWSSDPDNEIIKPIFEGTQNVLRIAAQENVRKIIFTSSCASIGMDTPEDIPLTEERWNLQSQTPLVHTKMKAELWAWHFSIKNRIEFISLCPPSIVGPGFFRHTPGTVFYEKILLGKLPPLPKGGYHLVDVRDLAEAHSNAYENPKANGRYIVAGQYFKISDFMQFLKKIDPQLRIPNFQIPSWSLQIVRLADWINHEITNSPRQLTGDLILEFVGKYQRVCTKKAIRDLNWKPRPVENTILDTFQWIRENILNVAIKA